MKFVVYKSRSKFRARDVKDPTIFTTIFSVESYITGNAVRCFLSLSFFFNFLIPLCCVECILPPINATCTIKNNTSPHQKRKKKKRITLLKVASISISLLSLKPHCSELLFLNAKEKKRKKKMADKPSRALILYGDGLAPFIQPSHTHLHSLSSKASCGFLTLPNGPSSGFSLSLSLSLSLSKFLYNWHFISCLLVMLSIPIR